MRSISDFYKESVLLIQEFNNFARQYELMGHAKADHLCFKSGSKEVFEEMRAILEPESVFVYQPYISGRRIAVIKLKKSFETNLESVSVLELSDQKPNKSQVTGFDHLEIYPTMGTYEGLVAHLEHKGVLLEKKERPHHTTHEASLSAQYNIKLTREPLIEKIKRDELKVG